MIGYMKPLGPSHAEQRLFRAYQCALCHTLGEEYGLAYRMFAGPDLVLFNVYADLMAERDPEIGRRACVLSPLGDLGPTLPVAARTDSTRFTAAFGVYMGVEKLRDDYNDEGGWLRWLAWRTLSPGWRRARAVLEDMGFPVEVIDTQMAAQAQIEAGTPCTLEEAAEPTRAIARALFAHPAPAGDTLGAEIGARVGAYLFYMDNLIDYHKDRREGAYNAIAQAFPGEDLTAAAREAALDGAASQINALRWVTGRLPSDTRGTFVRKALVQGFADKQQRLARMTAAELKTATLRRVSAPVRSRLTQLQHVMTTAAAYLMVYAFPASPWALRAIAEDTGQKQGGGGGGGSDSSACDSMCQGCGEGVCAPACNNGCNSACNGGCDGLSC